MSRQELADEANSYLYEEKDRHATLTANYVGKLERGLFRWPDRDYREAFRSILSAPSDAELGFFITRTGDGRSRSRVAYVWMADLTDAASAAETPVPHGSAQGSGSAAVHDVVENVAFRWLIAPPDSSVGSDVGQRHVGRADVEWLKTVRVSFKALDNAQGGGAVIPIALAFLQRDLTPMLDGRYDDETGRALFSASAELTLDVAWMAYDLGYHNLAANGMSRALRLSHAGGDRLFGSRVLTAMSHQALHLGKPDLSVDLARAAAVGAGSAAPPRARSMLAAMEAMAHAARQDRRECINALRTAECTLEAARDGSGDPLWLDFDEGGLWGHAARAYRYLDNGRECVRYAEQSIGLCNVSHGRTRAQRQAILSAGQLAGGNAEHAAETGMAVIAAALSLRSGHVDEEIANLAEAIRSRGSAAPECEDFLEQADQYRAARGLID